MLPRDLLGWVEKLDALSGVGVQVAGGEAALLILEAVGVEADEIDLVLFALHVIINRVV